MPNDPDDFWAGVDRLYSEIRPGKSPAQVMPEGEDPSFLQGVGRFGSRVLSKIGGQVLPRTGGQMAQLASKALTSQWPSKEMGGPPEPDRPGPIRGAAQSFLDRSAETLYGIEEKNFERSMEGDVSGADKVADFTGEIVGEGAKYMAGGALMRPLLGLQTAGKVAKGAKMAPRVVAGVKEAAKDAAAVFPVDALSSQRSEDSSAYMAAAFLDPNTYEAIIEDPAEAAKWRQRLSKFGIPVVQQVAEKANQSAGGRAAFEAVFGFAADLALRGVAGGAKGLKRANDVQRANLPGQAPAPPAPPRAAPVPMDTQAQARQLQALRSSMSRETPQEAAGAPTPPPAPRVPAPDEGLAPDDILGRLSRSVEKMREQGGGDLPRSEELPPVSTTPPRESDAGTLRTKADVDLGTWWSERTGRALSEWTDLSDAERDRQAKQLARAIRDERLGGRSTLIGGEAPNRTRGPARDMAPEGLEGVEPPPPDLMAPENFTGEPPKRTRFGVHVKATGRARVKKFQSQLKGLSDDALKKRYLKYTRGLGRTQMDAETSYKGMRSGEDPHTGEIGSGFRDNDWEMYARGRYTQSRDRLTAAEREMKRRGLEFPDGGEAFRDVRPGDVDESNADLAGGAIRSMSDAELEDEIARSLTRFDQDRSDNIANERLAILYEEAEREGRNISDDVWMMGRVLVPGLFAASAATSDDPDNQMGLMAAGLLTGVPGKWYSRLLKAVEGGPGKASVEQWMGYLNPAKRGFKLSEMDEAGLREWFKTQDGTVTKEDVIGFLGEKLPKVEERVRGEPDVEEMRRLDAEWAVAARATRDVGRELDAVQEIGAARKGRGTTYYDKTREEGGDYLSIAHATDDGEVTFRPGVTPEQREVIARFTDAERRLKEATDARDAVQYGDRTKFGKYTVGERGRDKDANYRETLLKLPRGQSSKEAVERVVELQRLKREAPDRTVELGDLLREHGVGSTDRANAMSVWHYPPPYGRGIEGAVESLVEVSPSLAREKVKLRELLSATQANHDVAVRLEAAQKAVREARTEFTGSHWQHDPNTLVHLRTTDRMVNGERTLFIEEIQSDWHQKGKKVGYDTPEAKKAGSVPDAPFKNTDDWVALAARRSIQQAVDGGYDRVAWASGQQAADLYDLRKQVSRILYFDDGTLRALDHNGLPVIDKNVPEDELADAIGKDPARRLLEQEAVMGRRAIEGDDLSVGGEGMDEFYNRIVPKVFTKEAKKLGVKLEPVAIEPAEDWLPDGLMYRTGTQDEVEVVASSAPSAPPYGGGPTKRAARAEAMENAPTYFEEAGGAEPSNLSFKITPEASQKVKDEGLPLYGLASPLAGAAAAGAAGYAADGEEGALMAAGVVATPKAVSKTLRKKLATLWRTGLLTNPATHSANVLGNTAMMLTEAAKDGPAAATDILLTRIAQAVSGEGQRTKGGISLRTLKASKEGAKKGYREAKKVFIEGGRDGMEKYDLSKEVNFDDWGKMGPIFNAYAGPDGYIVRFLTGTDKFFREVTAARSLREQAELAAREEGLHGAARESRAKALMKDEALQLRAAADAEVTVFLNEGKLAKSVQGLREPLGALGDLLVPFARTPSNIAERVLEYTPVGTLLNFEDFSSWLGKVRQRGAGEGLSPEDAAELLNLQRKMSERTGRSVIGTMVIGTGWILHEKGVISSDYPSTDARERNRRELAGIGHHAVKVGDNWYSLNRLSPVGNLLLLGADLRERSMDEDAGALDAAGVTGKALLESSPLRGVQGALDMLSDPERNLGGFLRDQAGSVVPAVVGAGARATDRTMRDARTPGQRFRSRVPGLSQSVEPRINAFGEEITRPEGALSAIGEFFAPATATKSNQDDVLVKEMERVGASIPPYRTRDAERGTPEYTRLMVRYGKAVKQAIRETVQSSDYQRKAIREARTLMRQDPTVGTDLNAVVKKIRADMIEQAASTAKSRLTRDRRR